VQAILRDGNPNLRSPAQISLDPAKHLRPPSFEEGIAEYAGACSEIPPSMAACREEQRGLHACINVCCMLCRLYPEGPPGPVEIDALLQQDAGCISGFASQLQVGIQNAEGFCLVCG
jgi:hypothetical protein